MYVITAHQRHGRTDRQTDRRTDVKRSHDRYIAKACSGKNKRPYYYRKSVYDAAALYWFLAYICPLRLIVLAYLRFHAVASEGKDVEVRQITHIVQNII